MTSGAVATEASVPGLHVGTSGWSYPSWRPGFYPAAARPEDFLRFYAERFDTVELNTTGYRLPAEDQFDRWAAATPPGFRFAVKLPARFLRQIETFERRVRLLGDRLGPIRVLVPQARDDGWLALFLGSVDPDLDYVFDFQHESWDGVDVPARVSSFEGEAPFRYLRFRDPPYSDDDLRAAAGQIAPLLVAGIEVYAYFRHEEEPTAPLYAASLLQQLRPMTSA